MKKHNSQIHCSLCHSHQTNSDFCLNYFNVPLFQNKVYSTKQAAKSAPTGDITLTNCDDCNFFYNSVFDHHQMHYDKSYHNEQAGSECFQELLMEVKNLFISLNFQQKKNYRDRLW